MQFIKSGMEFFVEDDIVFEDNVMRISISKRIVVAPEVGEAASNHAGSGDGLGEHAFHGLKDFSFNRTYYDKGVVDLHFLEEAFDVRAADNVAVQVDDVDGVLVDGVEFMWVIDKGGEGDVVVTENAFCPVHFGVGRGLEENVCSRNNVLGGDMGRSKRRRGCGWKGLRLNGRCGGGVSGMGGVGRGSGCNGISKFGFHIFLN